MRTPLLIEVPKDSPSRHERIQAFKKEHQIETHLARHMTKEEGRWTAGYMPWCRLVGYGVTEDADLCECFAQAGRLIEEVGFVAHGTSEINAIRTLCENVKIQCDL